MQFERLATSLVEFRSSSYASSVGPLAIALRNSDFILAFKGKCQPWSLGFARLPP